MAKIDLFDKIYDILDIVAFSGYAWLLQKIN